jgi:hypothetical protein
MNGIDYSRKLDVERQNYRQKADESRRASESYANDVKENSENKIQEIRENSQKHKAKLEEKFADSYENLDRSSKDSLLDKQLTFNKKLDSERKEFSGIRRENLEDFNRRFKVLNDSYETSINDLKETSSDRNENLRSDFDEKVSTIENNKEQKLKEMQDRSIDANRKITVDYRNEKDGIVKSKDDEMHKLVKQEQGRRNFLKETAVKSVEDLRRDQGEALRVGREVANSRFQGLQANSDKRIQELDEKNTQTIKEVSQKSKEDALAQSKSFKEAFQKQDYENRQELRELDYRNKANGVGKDSANFDILGKKRELEKISEERRIDTLKDQKENIEKIYAERETKATDSFQDGYRDMRIELSGKLQEQERDMSEINRQERYKDLKEMANKDDSHYKVLTEERNNSAKELGKVKKNAREKVERISKTYAGDLKGVQLRADAQVDMVKKSTTEEKLELQNKLQERGQDNLSQERKIQNEKYAKMENSFNKKVLNLETKNVETKTTFENKMRNLITATNDKIKKTTEDMKKTNESQLKIERDNNESKLKQLRDSMAILRSTSDKKLNDQRLQNTQKVSELTYGYEQKLKNQEQKFQDIIDQNQRKAEIDQDRLRLATAQEKETLMAQYEQKLERMESMNNQKLTNMEKYAGLQISQKRSTAQA